MPNTLPKQVLIVGGGTAGWITAAMLARSWPKSTKITLIESPTIGRVGVGESTIPSMQTLIRFLGIDEAEFMRQTHATFKCTLHMVGWNVEEGQAQDSYHPLFGWREDQVEILDEWICDWGSTQEPNRFIDCFQGVHLAQHKKSPKKFDDGPHQGAVQYAYHLDAVRLADFLRDWAVERGVVHLLDDVTTWTRTAGGDLESVTTNSNGTLRSDMFFDCSGFRSLLMLQALEEPYLSYSNDLYCDSAVAIPSFPNWDQRGIACETRATTLCGGWCWEVPLQTRQGNGYVYSSNELTPQEAELELIKHLGDVRIGEPRHLTTNTGRLRNAWVRNCIAVGLSAGFVEPLESTSIFAIQFAVSQFLLANRNCDAENIDAARDEFNKINSDFYDGIRDFIVAHYYLASRTDTEFWRANTSRSQLPALLEEVLRRWDHGDQIDEFLRKSASRHLVSPVSWYCILTSLNRIPKSAILKSSPNPSLALKFSKRVEETIASTANFPDHWQYFRRMGSNRPLP